MRYTVVVNQVETKEYEIEADSIEEAAAAYLEGDYRLGERYRDEETLEEVFADGEDVTKAFEAAVEAN